MRMFFMLILMMMSSALAMAQDSYGLKIAGVEVTSENCKDLSVIEGVEGKISYNPETNTLTMQDATIDNVDNGIFINSSEGLNIEVLGDNSITTENVCITGWASPCRIGGSGTLRLKSAESAGIYAYNSQAVIVGIKLYTEGLYGIGGNNGESGEMLSLRNVYVEATGSNGSLCDFQNVVLDGCSITQPAGAAFDANVHAVALNGAVVKDKVVIEPELKKYGIRIAGVEVTEANYESLSDIDAMNSGEMSYDPETKTLTMNEVDLSAYDSDIAIENYGCENLNIKVIGYVGISTTEAECIHLDEATTISGTGTINMESDENQGIIFSKSLTVDGMRLYCAEECGITGDTGDKEVLTVRNAYVEACAISNIKSLVLDGSTIVQPEGAAFDATLKGVAFEGDLATDVLIKPTDYLGIDVAGVMVTKANCADLSVLDGVTGKLSYDPMTNTLTMQDCTISPTTSDLGLFTEEGKDLKVEILGNNNITARDGCIMLYGKSIIGGSGTLNVTCTNNTAIFARTPSLTIEGIRLIVEGDWSGITGFDGQTEVITVRNAYVEVTGGLGSIDDIKDLVLEGCSIVQPKGAAFDATLKCVALNGEKVTDKVVIEPDASGINDITADVPARKKGIFTVQGVKLTQSWNELPAGIYIVDGVKRVKK